MFLHKLELCDTRRQFERILRAIRLTLERIWIGFDNAITAISLIAFKLHSQGPELSRHSEVPMYSTLSSTITDFRSFRDGALVKCLLVSPRDHEVFSFAEASLLHEYSGPENTLRQKI